MANRIILGLCTMFLLCAFTGCNNSNSETIDLNKVLAVFDRVTKRPKPDANRAADKQETEVAPSTEDNEGMTQTFLKEFASELNKEKLINGKIGITLIPDGAIEGFRDRDNNGRKDARDDRLFTIEIDPDNGRVIATGVVEGKTHRRDHYYHRPYYGHWGYYWYGSMWGRQNRYYSSHDTTRPNYNDMKMTPSSQHTSSVSNAKTRAAARSARSRGGSRGFRGGK